MKYIVDRIEGKYSVCENEKGEMVNIELKDLPKGVKEGNHLLFENNTYTIVPADKDRTKRIKNLMDDLWGG